MPDNAAAWAGKASLRRKGKVGGNGGSGGGSGGSEEEGAVNEEPVPEMEQRPTSVPDQTTADAPTPSPEEEAASETNDTAASASSPEQLDAKAGDHGDSDVSEEGELSVRRSTRHRSGDELSAKDSPSRPDKRIKIHATAMHQCEQCGKVYKHKNCLIKHGWEHHESWNMTKKWCQTKHQQVQMLEAAHVLMGISSGITGGSGGGDAVTTLPQLPSKSRKSQAA